MSLVVHYNRLFSALAWIPTALCVQLFLSSTTVLAESDLGNEIYDKADFIFNHASNVDYSHHHVPASHQVIFDGDLCSVHSDCSGFVSYVLKTVAPKPYKLVRDCERNRPYPQAKFYARFFSGLSSGSPQGGWLKVDSYRDLRRGDIIAWAKPEKPGRKGGNTGHVMIVAAGPQQAQSEDVDGKTIHYVEVPVIDSSSVYHFKPEELPPHTNLTHRNGLGKGLVRIILDSDGRAVGYWEGTYWGEGSKVIKGPTNSDLVEFARLVSNG